MRHISAWMALAVCCGLMLSDQISRQIVAALFPLIKTEWDLSDSALGMISGVVPVAIALLTIPLSVVADRVGHARSIIAMALLWTLATLGCGLAENFEQLMAARVVLGVGEAAFGSIGLAVVLRAIPSSSRATASALFMTSSVVGPMLGVGLGGVVAAQENWRAAFFLAAAIGVVFSGLFVLIANPAGLSGVANRGDRNKTGLSHYATHRLGDALPQIIVISVGCGFQLFAVSSLIAWSPSYFNRYYDLSVSAAAHVSGGLYFVAALGLTLFGAAGDRLSKANRLMRDFCLPLNCAVTALAVLGAFQLPPGSLQMILLAVAMFVGPGIMGIAAAKIAELAPKSAHGTAFAILTMAINVLGFAAGPMIVGRLADALGLDVALQLTAIGPMFGFAAFILVVRNKQFAPAIGQI